jgi:hypothetical protein
MNMILRVRGREWVLKCIARPKILEGVGRAGKRGGLFERTTILVVQSAAMSHAPMENGELR